MYLLKLTTMTTNQVLSILINTQLTDPNSTDVIPEEGKIKCGQYWPLQEQETAEHGSCKIKLMAVDEGPDITRRELCLTHSSDGYKALKLVRFVNM